MVSGEPPGSRVAAPLDDTGALSSPPSAKAGFSEADLVGEANKLSGRICSMLFTIQTEEDIIASY